ncbi:hypothetical protein Q4516_03220 [Mesomycoplasma ovipneumoniae]|uniref:hypothetical protein n=1 Tax=Mesomycoplasma ovipneumoniae TaxID=29562 RepID=UPI0026E1B612|nr:hypothetical protein [Mesomycoplasma ovipneumoniae]MDO6826299.1 hypothetical protein [Mesomycoplasma ovipneumoniae]MDO6856316.1 hypothetical protein [Mesomycoplasma ovipneumoniae]
MKIKQFFSKFIVISSLTLPFFLSSCGPFFNLISTKPRPSLDEDNHKYSGDYFLNLLDKHYEENNVKRETFSPLNFFYSLQKQNKDSKAAQNKTRNYFLGNKNSIDIYTLEEFQKKIVEKSKEITKEANIDRFVSADSIKKEFEEKFLNGTTIEETLKNNNILIMEHFGEKSLLSSRHYYFDDKVDAYINMTPFRADDIHFIQYTNLGIEPVFNPYFTVILYPKNKKIYFHYNFNKADTETLVTKTRKIYHDLEKRYLLPNYLKNKAFYDIFDEIKSIQKKNKIQFFKLKQPYDKVAEKLDPWVNNFFENKHGIIKNLEEFKDKIINRISKLDSNLKIDENEFINDFETKVFKGEKLENIFKNSNIFIYETWEKFVYGSPQSYYLNSDNKNSDNKSATVEFENIIITKEENNNIFLEPISHSDYSFNAFSRFFTKSKFNKVAFQILIVPKEKNIIFNKSINRLKTLESVIKNYLQK